jgi:hypothetical protein
MTCLDTLSAPVSSSLDRLSLDNARLSLLNEDGSCKLRRKDGSCSYNVPCTGLGIGCDYLNRGASVVLCARSMLGNLELDY